MAGRRGDRDRAADRHQQAEQDPAGPLGGDVEHHHEQAEEQEGRAQVVLEDQDQQAEQPDHDDRAEVAAARQVQAHEPAAGQRQGVPLDHQVAGEEHRQDDLGELAGLDGEAAHPDPDLGAEVLLPGREEGRRGEQDQGQHHRDVGVALEHPVVLQEDHHRDEAGDPERRPHQLVLGRRVVAPEQLARLVQPPDHHHPEPVQQGGDRQHQRIRVRREAAHQQVRDQRQGAHAEPVAEHPGGQLGVHREADVGVREDRQQHREEQQDQLGVAPVGCLLRGDRGVAPPPGDGACGRCPAPGGPAGVFAQVVAAHVVTAP